MIPDDDLELYTTPTAGPNMLPPPASPPANRRKSGNTIRERVGRLLTKGQPGQRPRSQSADRLSVQNFTFADSKIGTMMLAQREQEQALQVGPDADLYRQWRRKQFISEGPIFRQKMLWVVPPPHFIRCPHKPLQMWLIYM